MNNNNTSESEIVVFAEVGLYAKEALFKCLYWYTKDFHVNISVVDDSYRVSLVPKSGICLDKEQMQAYMHKLESDIIDFNLRDIVSKETKNIRELLIAKAFSNGEFDEDPPGSISDPVGFNIS